MMETVSELTIVDVENTKQCKQLFYSFKETKYFISQKIC